MRNEYGSSSQPVGRFESLNVRSLSWAATLLILLGISAAAFYGAANVSSASRGAKKAPAEAATTAPQSAGESVIARSSARFASVSSLLVPPSPPTVATFDSNCANAQSVFGSGDVVCAKVSDAMPGWQLIWSNSNFVAAQTSTITSANQNITFTLSSSPALGDWRVIIFDPIGGGVYAVTRFTVSAATATHQDVDVQVAKGQVSSDTTSGAQVLFSIQVTNAGPDDASNVTLTDVVPANTTFKLFDQLSGPTFTCVNPADEATGTSTCTIASLARGATATFLATYKVDSGVPAGSTITNTATVGVTPPSGVTINDLNPDNDTSTATVPVLSAPCVLTCPDSITQDADAGQAGAVVNYATPSTSGDCGQPITGEGGETIPVVSCNPASGSFFDAGTTTVICSSQTGTVCSFQVTINNPGGLAISLNGASTLTVECGQRFSDPGATAVNGQGQSVPVDITNPQGFTPDAPTAGTYVITYTATSDPNSVSTTRTVNVVDTEAPEITIQGANPYKIIEGACLPFIDPGVSALDSCAGSKPVTTTISGPNGATSVNNSVPGTYTVTYTATDGTHSATKTRTVLVGQFSEDEADQPASSNTPPTITLNGDDQISIECGTAFSDPGATATVCGNPVQVTTSGTVNIHAPGTYTISYTATANNLTSTATRTVTVTPDNTAPVIQILGANPMSVECHTAFTDPGATAHDACAGDFPATASGSVNPNVVGQYTITYNATDPSGFAATPVSRVVNVVDTIAPVVTAPPNVTVYTGSNSASCSVVVSDAALGTGTATDSCAGSLSVTRSGVPAGNAFPVGQTTVTYSANDGSNTGTATQTVTVIDNTAPIITTNGQTLSMWPPNHKYQTFQITNFVTGASDNCTSLTVADVVIEKVTSDEIENGNGDGNTLNDIVIAADCKSVQLRAEREASGNGRVYTITFKVADASGNVGHATALVTVVHNPGEAVVDSGPHYTVNGTCP